MSKPIEEIQALLGRCHDAIGVMVSVENLRHVMELAEIGRLALACREAELNPDRTHEECDSAWDKFGGAVDAYAKKEASK